MTNEIKLSYRAETRKIDQYNREPELKISTFNDMVGPAKVNKHARNTHQIIASEDSLCSFSSTFEIRWYMYKQNKEEGIYQESTQSSSTGDMGHHMGK